MKWLVSVENDLADRVDKLKQQERDMEERIKACEALHVELKQMKIEEKYKAFWDAGD